jgi:hypothetical protein
MLVAYVAYQELTPSTKTRANALVSKNPMYNRWQTWLPAGASKADKDAILFMIAARWADQIKSEPGYETTAITAETGRKAAPIRAGITATAASCDTSTGTSLTHRSPATERICHPSRSRTLANGSRCFAVCSSRTHQLR